MSDPSPDTPEIDVLAQRPGAVSVDLDGELQLAKLQQMFAGCEAEPVRYRQWEVEGHLGAGGMGRVYLARHLELDRRVALKLVKPGLSGDDQVLALRVIREAQALARVNHDNVLAIHQVDRSGERTVIEMEYVEGETMRSWQSAPERGWRALVAAYASAGDGLAAVHDAGLLHRDIKPDNLLVGPDGKIKVADLGLAIAASAAAGREAAPDLHPRRSCPQRGTLRGCRCQTA